MAIRIAISKHQLEMRACQQPPVLYFAGHEQKEMTLRRARQARQGSTARNSGRHIESTTGTAQRQYYEHSSPAADQLSEMPHIQIRHRRRSPPLFREYRLPPPPPITRGPGRTRHTGRRALMQWHGYH